VNRPTTKTAALTTIALLAFAGNSVLCRLALGSNSIDAASFTIIRLLSGIMMLSLILIARRRRNGRAAATGSWAASLMLFIYATAFSFAYITLDTGTGALILFGAVQITMIMIGLFTGQRLHFVEWAGVLMAFSGFVYLVLPGLTPPSLSGFLLMTAAGVAWGIYTLKGRDSRNPSSDTACNFLRTLPLIIILGVVLVIFALPAIHLSPGGILLAILSGALASGIGYTVWYHALGGLSVSKAAVVQLLVPVMAALGGVIFASETISLHLMLSSLLVLGGILIVIRGRDHIARATE